MATTSRATKRRVERVEVDDEKIDAPKNGIVTLPMQRMPLGVRPELQQFAKALRNAMADRQMNASDLAKQIWGTVKDPRGYPVAKNRDRIGTYLAGTGYPSRESMEKLCQALGLQPDAFPVPTHTRAPREFTAPADVTFHLSTELPGLCVLGLRPMTMRAEIGLEIIKIINTERERMSKE